MTDKMKSSPSDSPTSRHAKGAARETIGKLIGDDTAVRTGREEQRRARDAEGDTAGDDTQQEQE